MNNRYRYCFKQKKLICIDFNNDRDHIQTERSVEIEQIQHKDGIVRVVTKAASAYKEFDKFFQEVPSKLCSLGLSQAKYCKVIDILKEFLTQSEQLCEKISENSSNDTNSKNVYKVAIEYVLNQLSSIDTDFKFKKRIKSHPMYVKPNEVAIDLKWRKPKMNDDKQIPSHSMTQTTFQFVSPIKTLNCCFSNETFRNCYFQYNLGGKHQCVDNVYQDFCCGSVCKSKEVFRDPLSLKIQLGVDDFEICCPLKSKSNIHKVCATYMQIRNMPIEYKSKIDNIYLVALCDSSNVKTTTYNYIAEIIVDELKVLEQIGIDVNDRIIKGSLVNIACDNLGANSIFGFTECFVASFSCRHCETSKEDCQKQTVESENKMRTKESYNNHVQVAERLHKEDLKKTKGIKRGSEFNKLEYFHAIDNVSVDLMHDFNEGVVAYALHDFFGFMVEKRILTLSEIQSRVRDFCYSNMHKYNTPSLISVDKNHLNQSASQIYCLMIHMPFIFYDLKDEISEYWSPMQTLLKCMQIAFSYSISENDVQILKCRISDHLKAVKQVFNRRLTAKHHFLVHYPNSIRKMGPPIKSWTMRLEAKHKSFTEIAKNKKNFINSCQTMANNHQDQACKYPVVVAQIVLSKKYGQFAKTMEYTKYEEIIIEKIGSQRAVNLRVHHFLKYDDIDYRTGHFVIFNNNFYKITHILSDDEKVMFVCNKHKIIRENDFCVSLIVENLNENACILDFDLLLNKAVYYHVYLNGEVHVIANTLSVAHLSG